MNFEKKQTEERMRRLIRFVLRYRKKWAAAGLMLALGAGTAAGACFYVPKQTRPALASEEAPATPDAAWETETTAQVVMETTAAEEEWKPTPGELNLTHFFPEGADQSDMTKSLAGEAFKILMTHDEEWISGIYDFSDVTPAQMASRLGRSGRSVMGHYNPKDSRHDRNDPGTWTVNTFKNIRMTAQDGDGNSITPYSNVLEIMSMANLYTYFKGVEDYDLFLSYSKELWGRSHSYTVSMSEIYYCSGCMSEDAERREMEELEAEAKAEALGLTAEESPESDESMSESTQDSGSDAAVSASQSASTVILAGKTSAEKASEAAESAAEASRAVAASASLETVPESTSGVIVSRRNLKETDAAEETLAAAPENKETAAGAVPADAVSVDALPANAVPADALSADTVPVDTLTADTAPADTLPADAEATGAADLSAKPSDPSAISSGEAGSQAGATPSDALASRTVAEKKENLTDCPGHVDLIIHMKIIGLDEKNSLFELDPIGGDKANLEDNGWQGWNQYTKASARLLSRQDWFGKYGLTVSSISARNPLTQAEIEAYMAQLPADLSQTRKDIVRFALNSVGRVPYYWGGKPIAPNYASNSFGVLTTPDYKGRVYRGLDCSGWINWVYWSVTGRRLPYESTSGLAVTGTKIQRNELQPGDIIVRTGADAHVIMFLDWTADGKIQCIHESSAAVNNVTVAVRDANWRYYRRLVE